jgi:hypothetical protein
MADKDKDKDKAGAARADGKHDDGKRMGFAEGSVEYPTLIQGLGGALTAAAAGGNVSTLTPVPKTGFVGSVRHVVSGTITVGTTGTQYTVPLHRLIGNYTFANSLQFPYRSLNGATGTTGVDDLWMWNYVNQGRGSQDPIYGSLTSEQPVVTTGGAKAFQFAFTDQVAMNNGINFSKFLLSALTNSNDLSFLISWLPQSALGILGANTVVFTSYTASDQVSAVYQTVPDPDHYYWPDTSVIQQVIGDPSFSAQAAVGVNSINLTPISGPEFLGIGVQIVNTGGTLDTLLPATSAVTQVRLLVAGSIPLKTFSLADLVQAFENLYGRQPAFGYLYIDLMADLCIPNVMSSAMRKVLSTNKYAQLTLEVTLNSNFTPGTGARINLLKRTRQSYASNG